MISHLKHKRLALIMLLTLTLASHAEQYQSNELLESKSQNAKTVKSIAELEAELSGLQDAYTKDSTARYLARHYAQKNTQASLNKAIEYYRMSLKGDGLSVYAKQATMLELLALLYVNKMYQDFLKGIKQYVGLQGSPSAKLKIKIMLSHYHLKQKKQALVQARSLFDAYQKTAIDLDVDDLNQILFTLYNLQDYISSAKVQQELVSLDENSVKQWLRLSKMHLKNNKPDQAAQILLMAMQKGLAMEQDDLLLMCDLISLSGNPFIAARLMNQLLADFQVDLNVENYDRLFKYWYLSQEVKLASMVLKTSLKYDFSTKRHLDLAELYYQQQDWLAMNAIIKQACDLPLQAKYVSRANLLLGISELKLNNKDDAIDAFYNATMISGRVKEAVAYLKYLNVDISDYRQNERISGICTPARG